MEEPMHEMVFAVAAVWMTALLAGVIIFMIWTRSPMSRLLALDTLSLILIAFLMLFAGATRAAYYLDAALALALLSFLATVAAARYHSERRLF